MNETYGIAAVLSIPHFISGCAAAESPSLQVEGVASRGSIDITIKNVSAAGVEIPFGNDVPRMQCVVQQGDRLLIFVHRAEWNQLRSDLQRREMRDGPPRYSKLREGGVISLRIETDELLEITGWVPADGQEPTLGALFRARVFADRQLKLRIGYRGLPGSKHAGVAEGRLLRR